MLAATSTENKLDLKQVPRPAATKNAIVIKNKVLGINYIDPLQILGRFPIHSNKIAGSEAAGEVVEVGEGITNFKVGDRVISCEGGSHAEYSILHEADVKSYKIPDNISYEAVATFALQGLTAITLVERAYIVQKGDIVLVHAAAGGVGSLLVQLIHQKGGVVIGTTSSDEKAAYIKGLGADHVINYKKENILERVLEITHGKGVHLSLDSIGGSTFEDSSINTLRFNGTVISFGFAAGLAPAIDIPKLFQKNNRIQGSSLWGYFTTKEEATKWWSRLFELISQDILKATVYKTYSFGNIGEAFNDISSGKTHGKLIVKL